MPSVKIENMVISRIGDSDDVYVSATINDTDVRVHVWYSHLYGGNERSLNGDKKAIQKYLNDELFAEYARNTPQALTI